MKYKHKQKQNQRIQKITESTLVVGADIASKHTSLAQSISEGLNLVKNVSFKTIAKD
ncbi:hypothetical protein [Effusibacillus consociatus]|uniref:IS110 family transposase n=1 Tax=Effusibacillus consociatus TaxID=1117041 RepID=A0ABV9Q2X0_9BACL